MLTDANVEIVTELILKLLITWLLSQPSSSQTLSTNALPKTNNVLLISGKSVFSLCIEATYQSHKKIHKRPMCFSIKEEHQFFDADSIFAP